MAETLIEIRNLSKDYNLGVIGYGSFIKDCQRLISRLSHHADPNAPIESSDDMIKALDMLSLDIRKNDCLGIIGANGAGKSTLLKIISRITLPSDGTVKIKGQIGSLLGIESGFQSDLTGRQNIHLKTALYGMTPLETSAAINDIIAFAELERFIDTPVKRYSSGMYMRLAFAIAVHVPCDILIVDEILSVSDEHFRQKCYARIHALASSGKTTIFVGHDLKIIEQLCSRCVWLDSGKLKMDGSPQEVLKEYRLASRAPAPL